MRRIVFVATIVSIALCTLDDLVNGLTQPAIPIVRIASNMAKPYIIQAMKGIVEQRHITDPLKSVPRQPLPSYLTPSFAPSLNRMDQHQVSPMPGTGYPTALQFATPPMQKTISPKKKKGINPFKKNK